MKRVVVTMSDECHRALKQYAAFYGKTMGEVLYHNTRVAFHTQAKYCNFVDDVLSKLGIRPDKRREKPCFGFLCHGCVHSTACRTGMHKGLVELEDHILSVVKDPGKELIQKYHTDYESNP